MGIGAYLKTVLNASVSVASRQNPLHGIHWQFLLSGVASGLVLCTAATTSQASNLDVSDINLPQSDVIADGVYLYGSAPEPDTLGAAYMVFEAQDAHLVGAMFMPQSSFDCFQGYRDGNELALQITNSYTQEVYGYAIALVTDDLQVASANNPDFVLALEGFYDLGTPADSDMAILSICQATYSSVGTDL